MLKVPSLLWLIHRLLDKIDNRAGIWIQFLRAIKNTQTDTQYKQTCTPFYAVIIQRGFLYE